LTTSGAKSRNFRGQGENEAEVLKQRRDRGSFVEDEARHKARNLKTEDEAAKILPGGASRRGNRFEDYMTDLFGWWTADLPVTFRACANTGSASRTGARRRS